MSSDKIQALNHRTLSARSPEQLRQMQELGSEDRKRDLKLKEKARELESLFLTQLLKVMEGTIPGKGLGGSSNNLASMMFSNVMAENISEQGGMGLSDMLYNSLRDRDADPDLPDAQNDFFMENLNSVYKMILGEDS